MRQPFLLLPVLLLGACSLISPYTITFTNSPDEVIDPATSTLDFVVSAPTLAYISGVSCEGAEALDILPLADKDSEASTVHKLPLTLMKDQPSGAKCEVTVTAYDRTTTDQASASIELMMAGIPLAKEGEMCGGIAAIQCADGLTCNIPDASTPDAGGTCVKPEEDTVTEDPAAIEEETVTEDPAATEEETAPVVETPTVDTSTDASVTTETTTEVTPPVEETTPPADTGTSTDSW